MLRPANDTRGAWLANFADTGAVIGDSGFDGAFLRLCCFLGTRVQ